MAGWLKDWRDGGKVAGSEGASYMPYPTSYMMPMQGYNMPAPVSYAMPMQQQMAYQTMPVWYTVPHMQPQTYTMQQPMAYQTRVVHVPTTQSVSVPKITYAPPTPKP